MPEEEHTQPGSEGDSPVVTTETSQDHVAAPPDSTPDEISNEAKDPPMLDVHPAHHAATSWKEFFVHIATIVLGLLIAVGLEQTVEYFHHRSLGREAAEQLVAERRFDERSNEVNIFTTERHERDLKRDLAILHAMKAKAPLPNQPFIWRRFRFAYADDVWNKIHQSGTINYVDPVYISAYRYFNQEGFAARSTESLEALSHAASILRSDKDPLQVSLEGSITEGRFLNTLVDGGFTMDEASIERGYAPLIEHADLTKLTPVEIDDLERAIKIALADDDAQLSYCFNIKRNLQNHPLR
jgi:hypothetical protein